MNVIDPFGPASIALPPTQPIDITELLATDTPER